MDFPVRRYYKFLKVIGISEFTDFTRPWANEHGSTAGGSMKPRINVITLGVNDLQKSLAFYRDGLGLPTEGILGTEFEGNETDASGAIAFF